MRKSRFTTGQIAKILDEAASGVKVSDVCSKHGISIPTFYLWKSKHRAHRVSSVEDAPGAKNIASPLQAADGHQSRAGSSEDLRSLQERIQRLENENELLRKLFIEISLERVSVKSRNVASVA